MLSSSVLTAIGVAAFGGVAFAWVLPPTTPIGGPTMAEISHHAALATYSTVASVDPLPQSTQVRPPVYDPAVPPISLDSRSPTLPYRAVPVAEDSGYAGDDYGPRPDADDYEHAFRVGYRQAKRARVATQEDCDQFDDPARGDGCRKYLDEAAPPALSYDTPTS